MSLVLVARISAVHYRIAEDARIATDKYSGARIATSFLCINSAGRTPETNWLTRPKTMSPLRSAAYVAGDLDLSLMERDETSASR